MEQGGAQRVPWNDGIQEAVLQQIFGALEALGELFADGLLNHPRAGEADQGAGLGQHDVPQAGKAGGDAAGGGVGEHRDVEAALLGEPLQGGRGLGHLHQGEDTLLHPGPAAGGEKDEGELVLVGVLHQPGDLLPDGGGHAAHEKAAVQLSTSTVAHSTVAKAMLVLFGIKSHL